MSKKTVYIIAGPTASGKSARALDLAQQLDGVVINADSLQIYKDLPILAAIPDAKEMVDIPHRLYGFLDAEETYSAQKWRDTAEIEIHRAFAEGQQPIICGGTGFYITTLTKGLSPMPDVPDDVRARFTQQAAEEGAPSLHEYIQDHDPETAARLHPNDTQRLIRACEIFAATGKPEKIQYTEMPETLKDKYQYFTEATMKKLRDAGYDKEFTSLEDGVRDYVQNYMSQKDQYK